MTFFSDHHNARSLTEHEALSLLIDAVDRRSWETELEQARAALRNDVAPGPAPARKVADVAYDFVRYYTAGTTGCRNCGGLPHSNECFVERFVVALALDYNARGSLQAASVPPLAPVETKAWVLTERGLDGRERTEGIALSNESASEWVHHNDEPGCARTSMPFKIIGQAASVQPHADKNDHDREGAAEAGQDLYDEALARAEKAEALLAQRPDLSELKAGIFELHEAYLARRNAELRLHGAYVKNVGRCGGEMEREADAIEKLLKSEAARRLVDAAKET